ncbi:MAG TPA: hypothetical protein VN660_05980 [Steroidobacteraceae bacterium]|nr:hypothetical protein [Steroidobacteraceae bacterium]
MLAAVYDARQAIGLHDPIAAYNDISQALDAGRQAVDQGTVEQGTQSLTALLESFPVQAKLLSAQAQLTAGKVAAADALLVGIENLIPARLMPGNLSLREAAASLELARQAASLGTPQLRTQLLCAVAALRGALRDHPGTAHVQEAMALAAALDRTLANPAQLRTLLPEQVSIWLATVTQMMGTDRWA